MPAPVDVSQTGSANKESSDRPLAPNSVNANQRPSPPSSMFADRLLQTVPGTRYVSDKAKTSIVYPTQISPLAFALPFSHFPLKSAESGSFKSRLHPAAKDRLFPSERIAIFVSFHNSIDFPSRHSRYSIPSRLDGEGAQIARLGAPCSANFIEGVVSQRQRRI